MFGETLQPIPAPSFGPRSLHKGVVGVTYLRSWGPCYSVGIGFRGGYHVAQSHIL